MLAALVPKPRAKLTRYHGNCALNKAAAQLLIDGSDTVVQGAVAQLADQTLDGDGCCYVSRPGQDIIRALH